MGAKKLLAKAAQKDRKEATKRKSTEVLLKTMAELEKALAK